MPCVSQSVFCFFKYFIAANIMTASMFSKTSNNPIRFTVFLNIHLIHQEQNSLITVSYFCCDGSSLR